MEIKKRTGMEVNNGIRHRTTQTRSRGIVLKTDDCLPINGIDANPVVDENAFTIVFNPFFSYSGT